MGPVSFPTACANGLVQKLLATVDCTQESGESKHGTQTGSSDVNLPVIFRGNILVEHPCIKTRLFLFL